MRVLHVITGLQTGGAERQLVSLLGKRDGNFKHRVIALGGHGYLAERIRALGVPVDLLGLPNSPRALTGLLRFVPLVKREKPDIVQGWMYHGNLAASIAGRVAHCKIVWNIRQSLTEFNREKKLTRLAIRAGAVWSRSVTRTIYNSGTSAEHHKSAGYKGPPLIIPNGYDCAAFRYDGLARAKMRAELAFEEGDVVVGCVARFHPMKDHGNFLRAAARVKQQYSQTCFVLAGRGMTCENRQVNRLIKELGLSESVRLVGEREDMVQVYSSLDILASSSGWGEALPNVLGEAMACCVPCVATDVGDTGRLLGGTGRLVSPRDPEALAAAILGLCQQGPELRHALGASARKRIEQYYSVETMARRYEALYGSVAGNVCVG